MAAETLLSAAGRALRNYNIDMGKGGILTVETQVAMETLMRMVEAERSRPLPDPGSAARALVLGERIDRDMAVGGLTYRAGAATVQDILDQAAKAAKLKELGK